MLVLLVATVFVEFGMTAAAQGRPAPITAYDAHGKRLPTDPTLQAGQRITLAVRGFAPRTAVTVVDMNARQRSHATASRDGVVRVRYRVPEQVRVLRPKAVAFAGAPSGGYGRPAKRGNTRADVPLYRRFDYRLPRHHPPHHGTGGKHTGSGGGLANTGFDEIALLLAALTALTVGALAVRAGRHRAAP